ncbi:MAG: hypothetical protein ABSB78_14705 [Bacteroidota bacterium]
MRITTSILSHLFVLTLLLVLTSTTASAANYTSRAPTAWNITTTWNPNGIPVAGDNVTIAGGFNVIVTANAACASITFTTVTATSLTINSGITLNVSGAITIPRSGSGVNLIAVGAGILNAGSIAFTSGGGGVRHEISISTGTVTVTGDITTDNTGASATFLFTGAGLLKVGVGFLTTGTVGGSLTPSTGTVEYNAAGAQTVHGFTYNNLTLSGSGAKTTTGVTVNGILSMEGTATASAAPTYSAAATLQYNTATSRTAGVEWITPFAGTGGVIIANTGTITLNAAKVLNASVSLTINSGSTLSTSASNYNIDIGGNWTNNGTFTAGTSTTTFTGAAQTIGGTSSTTFNNLTLSGSGVKTFAITPTVNGILSMEGTATVSAAPTYGTAATLQYNTTTSRTAGVEWITPFAATGGVIIASTGTITLNAAKVLNASVPLTINNGATLSTGASNYNIDIGGNWTNNGTFTSGTSTTTFFAGANQTIGGTSSTTFNNLVVNKSSGTLSLTTNITLSGNLTITSGTFDLVTYQCYRTAFSGTFTLADAGCLRLSGNNGYTNAGYNYTCNFPDSLNTYIIGTHSTIEYYRSGNQDVVYDNLTFGKLILSGSGTKLARQEPKNPPAPVQDSSFVINDSLIIRSGVSLDVAQYVFYAVFNGVVNIESGATLNAGSGGGTVKTWFLGPTLNANGTYIAADTTFGTPVFMSETRFGNTTINGNPLTLYDTRITGYTTSNVNLTMNAHTPGQLLTFTIESGGTLNPAPTDTVKFNTLAMNVVGTARVTIANSNLVGQYIGTGTRTYSTGTIEFAGTNETVDNFAYGTLMISSPTVSLKQTVTAATLNVTDAGLLTTGANIMRVTSIRTGNGLVNGSLRHVHAFITGTTYYFEGPNTYVRPTAMTTTPDSITITSYPNTLIPEGNSAYAIRRYYTITQNGGSGLTSTLRLHYDTAERNGLTESLFTLWRYNGTAWEDKTNRNNTIFRLDDCRRRWASACPAHFIHRIGKEIRCYAGMEDCKREKQLRLRYRTAIYRWGLDKDWIRGRTRHDDRTAGVFVHR